MHHYIKYTNISHEPQIYHPSINVSINYHIHYHTHNSNNLRI